MKPNLPLNRRDVVALVIYIVLAYNFLNPLLNLVTRFVLARVPGLQTPPVSGRFLESAVTLGIGFVFSLAFMPFVPLIAGGATGRKSVETVTRQSLLPLIFTCVGLMMLLISFPQLGLTSYYYLRASALYGNSAPMVRPILLQNIALTIVFLSFGFALAFFPAILGGLRARVRDEEAVV